MNATDQQPDVLLTAKEAALQLKVQPDTVRQMCKAKIIKAHDISATGTAKARWRIKQSAIKDFLRMRLSEPPPPVRRRRKKPERKQYV